MRAISETLGDGRKYWSVWTGAGILNLAGSNPSGTPFIIMHTQHIHVYHSIESRRALGTFPGQFYEPGFYNQSGRHYPWVRGAFKRWR